VNLATGTATGGHAQGDTIADFKAVTDKVEITGATFGDLTILSGI